jgi:hypothetical protein
MGSEVRVTANVSATRHATPEARTSFPGFDRARCDSDVTAAAGWLSAPAVLGARG